MYVVHKIELKPGLNHYDLPLGSELLHVAMQSGTPMLWYLRPTIAPALENRILLLLGTGKETGAPPRGAHWQHTGTMADPMRDNIAVFHVFELLTVRRFQGTTGEQLVGGDR